MTCPEEGDSPAKAGVIPRKLARVEASQESWRKLAPLEGLAAHQVVGGVKAYLADDG